MTQSYVTPHLKTFWNSNTFYVSKMGADTNNGAVDTPFLTMAAAVTAAASGDTIMVGRGTYAEQLVINKSLYVGAEVPGSVNLQIAVNAASALTVAGTVANQRLFWEGINIVNTDNTGATAVALTITNAGVVAGHYIFRNCRISAGTAGGPNAATAVSFTGNVGAPTLIDIESPIIMGAHLLAVASAGDVVMYRNSTFTLGPAIWMRITGGVAGWVKVINSKMLGGTGTEYVEFGNGAATVAIFNPIDSMFNAYLRMNTTGAGYVLNQGSQFSYTTPNQVDQIIQYQNGDYLTINLQNISIFAAAAHTMYTVPVGRRFLPERVVTTNRGANTGADTYRYNGSAAQSILADLGAPTAIAHGSRVNVCLVDAAAAGANIQFENRVGSGAADFIEATVAGRLV